ncbi:MAG: hypothetical protein E4H48_10310 [Syntrophobacterales bacterium]|nr:MAG: hypothetical protein E4H48_10310 [Syntrophobacterales bacterium]
MLESPLMDILSRRLADAAQRVRGMRNNESLSDFDFALAGICRVLSKSRSGREWLRCDEFFEIARSTFFDALQSARRGGVVRELAHRFAAELAETMRAGGVDFIADIPTLADVEVIAVDGHEIEHPQHAERNAKGKFTSVKTIYQMDMHSGLSLPLARVGEDGLKAHEWPPFKRQLSERIKGRKRHSPLFYVLDRAYVDIAFWDKMGRKNVFMLTRYKENMNPMMKQPVDFDRKDPRNAGVTGCFLLSFAGLGMAYLIEYTDPESSTEYKFITTATQLQPGEIAWLYFCRWRIEKTFDTFENDLEEGKARATGNTAQLQQAHFISRAGNFLRYIAQMLDIHHGLRDGKVVRKYQRHLEIREAAAAGKGRCLSPFLDAGRRMAKLSLQYIRCFRKHFFGKSPPETYLADFGPALRAYL